jgi:uncharacterized protein (DUF1778 family)
MADNTLPWDAAAYLESGGDISDYLAAAFEAGELEDVTHALSTIARRVLEEHERMVLTGADKQAFLAAAANPHGPTARLIAAFRRHNEQRG